MPITRRRFAAMLAAPLVAPGIALAEDAPIPVVVTFTILADFVRQIGGKRVSVTSLVGPGGDVHVYEPTPGDVQKVRDAKVLVQNGLGLEGWLERLVGASGTKAVVVVGTNGVKPRTPKKGEPGAPGKIDPHAWQSVANVLVYADNILAGLIAADPDGKTYYTERADFLKLQINAEDARTHAAMAIIPAENRRIITTHDAFGYFGEAYGLTILAPLGLSTEQEPSARDLANIIRQIRGAAVTAVFFEKVGDPRLLDMIVGETGARIGGVLMADSLAAPDEPAGTYIGMVRHNIRELTIALRP